MIKKILVKGPALSRSGYGEQTRFALRALRTREDIFDIYLINIPWGHTGHIFADDEEREWLDNLMRKTVQFVQVERKQFDVSLQVTIPNEWEKIAPINIGYTAGIEATKVAPVWLLKGNEMDKIIIISNHSKEVYETSTCTAQNQDTGEVVENYRCETPIEVISYPVQKFEPAPIDGFKLEHDFNFLVVAQWGIRKNLDNTIKWFVEEFKDDEVGLVVKTNIAKDCLIDREVTTNRLRALLLPYKDRKCKVHLLHGTLSEGEMTWLYNHDKIKALISLSHGEGFGLPLFEAAYNGLPLITTLWSGQADFIYAPNKSGKQRPMVAKVGHTLGLIPPEAHWEGVLEKDAMWAYPIKEQYTRQLREVYKNHPRFKSAATKLQKHIQKNFKLEDFYADFVGAIYTEEELEWLKELGSIEIL
jgi:glycosyltransferase involved in cell wall biosynthesis